MFRISKKKDRCIVETQSVLKAPDPKELDRVKRQAHWDSLKNRCTLEVYVVGDDERVMVTLAKRGLHRGVLVAVYTNGQIVPVNERDAMLGEMGLLAELRDRFEALCANAVQTETTEKLTEIRERLGRVKARLAELRQLEKVEAEKARRF